GPWRAALLADPGLPITINTCRQGLAHRAVSLPGAGEQVEQIRSRDHLHIAFGTDITPRLSPPVAKDPS
ncbi:MAG: hypothetical protein ACLP0J_08935, partial [Solirubrobacteraceae bacterium]